MYKGDLALSNLQRLRFRKTQASNQYLYYARVCVCVCVCVCVTGDRKLIL